MKRSNSQYFVILCFLFFSCSDFQVTKAEQKAVTKIASMYQGSTTYGIKLESGTDGNIRSFEIEISKSEILDNNRDLTDYMAGNMAYIIHDAIKKGNSNYGLIRISLIFSGSNTQRFEYSTQTLQIVDKKVNYFNSIIDRLQKQDYKEISRLVDSCKGIRPFEKAGFIDYLRNADSTCGQIRRSDLIGFVFDNKKEIIRIGSKLMRNFKDTQFSADISMSPSNRPFVFKYEL